MRYHQIIMSFILIYTASWMGQSSAVTIHEVLAIIKFAKEVVITVSKTWNMVEENVDFPEGSSPILDETEGKVFDEIENINSRLDTISDQVEAAGASTMNMVLYSLPDRIRLELRLNDLLDYMTRMDVTYRSFENYVKNHNQIERLTLEDFAKHVVSHESSSVINLLERIHAFVVPSGRGITDIGLIKLLSKALEQVNGDMLCSFKQSPQQVISHLYDAIALTELKGYTMVQFSYMLLRLYNQGNFKTEAELMTARHEQRTNDAIELVRRSMKNASRQLWNCDPPKHEKGETYEEITRLLQGFIQNEVNLNNEDSCTYGCPNYAHAIYRCHDDNNCYRQYSQLQRSQRWCNGKIVDCKSYDSDLAFCPDNPFSDRRLAYVEFDNGRVFGRKQFCRRGARRLESWKRYWFVECSYCFCLCDSETFDSDRYINMRTVIADVRNNRVVTGLRFVKKNRIIHLQIQEGKLLPRGKIDKDTVHWVPVENYRITDRKIYREQDYHTLTWEKRAIDLDDIEVGEGHVVTGVRFKMVGSHLNFEIFATPFDFDAGELIRPFQKSTWKDNPRIYSSLFNSRTEIKLIRPDIPTKSSIPSIPTSTTNQFINFVNTDIDKDAAQTTVPFFDAQKVESLEPVPLSGAGIFHKGSINSGGFIAPKIITYDFSKHLQPAVFTD